MYGGVVLGLDLYTGIDTIGVFDEVVEASLQMKSGDDGQQGERSRAHIGFESGSQGSSGVYAPSVRVCVDKRNVARAELGRAALEGDGFDQVACNEEWQRGGAVIDDDVLRRGGLP